MKNRTIRRYIVQILIYTIVFAVLFIIMDTVFNGTVIDFLYVNLPEWAFLLIYQNRTVASCFIYILGLVIISAVYVFKLSRLLSIASLSINQDEPEIFGNNCPDDLREFSRKLQDFKYNLKSNEQARHLAEQQKNDLVVYLAHDLKTPLTSVIGYLSLLDETKDLTTEQKAKYIGIALNKAYRLEQLINEFFEITRLNLQTIPTEKSSVNITILLIQILNEFFPMLKEKEMNVIQNIEHQIVISADADKLARVFDNLFRNAVNYGYAGTDIICSARKENSYAIISVQNRGDDIPADKLSHIFDKFYRLDNSRQSSTGGTGLGLAIAKQIVELHGGSISVTSHNGITEFKVILPI